MSESPVIDSGEPPRHGADLVTASRRYGIPLSDWLDVSTGINPCAYPFRDIERAQFQHLPVNDSELCSAAKNYAQSPVEPIAAAGSQVLIQWLPLIATQLMKKHCRVAAPAIGYSEHAFRWQWAGHEIVHYDPQHTDSIDALLMRENIDVLIVINAHNPLGLVIAPPQLLAWREQLAQRGGWLIVDEAFIDSTPDYSIAKNAGSENLIVLRSLGKFFGLAGIRCGFAFCGEKIRNALQIAVGPWSVAGPAQQIAIQALNDRAWQAAMRDYLQTISAANANLLQKAFVVDPLRHALFNTIKLRAECATDIENQFAKQGIRVRLIEFDSTHHLLRFGLVDPQNTIEWERYQTVLNAF